MFVIEMRGLAFAIGFGFVCEMIHAFVTHPCNQSCIGL